MKPKFTSLCTISMVAIFFSTKIFGWGTDVIISATSPIAQHSIGAKQNGTLFAAVPTALLTLENGTVFYTSTDQGLNWSTIPVLAPTTLGPITRTKMVVTSLDSVICVIQQNNTLYFVNVESGVTGQFTTTGVHDFDVAAGSGNFIYAYVQEPGLSTIKRYGTGDGGISWTGNTATVTSQGAKPRVTMSGTRLILNYFGPPQADTLTSVIRAAIYNESAPGTLAASTFQDVAFNNLVQRKQFQTILNNGIAWFLFTEGSTQQVIKCRTSLDNGATYQLEFVVAGNAQINAQWIGVAPVNYSGTFGTTLTWLADSIAPSVSFDKMQFSVATNSNPAIFTVPPAPQDTYNDFPVDPTNTTTYPVMINYNVGLNVESGIAWVGEGTTGPALYYDALSFTTGIDEAIANNFTLYPSPANNFILLTFPENGLKLREIEIFDLHGKLVKHLSVSTGFLSEYKIDISGLHSGNYFVSIHSDHGIAHRKFAVAK